MFLEFYGWVCGWGGGGGGGGTKHFISFEGGVLNIFRRFWGVPNFMVEFWNTLHPPSTHTL